MVTWVAAALGGWLLWALALFVGQRRLVFPGRRGAPLEEVRLRAPAEARLYHLPLPGAVVEALWLPSAPTAPRPVPAVLFTHGNYELVEEWLTGFETLRRAGVGVLLVGYPGYGRSTGVATAESATAAAVAGWDLLAGMAGEVDADRIVALGRSVGGGPAAALSRRRPLAALLLSSTFTDLRAYARRYLVPAFLVRQRFDTEDAVRGFTGPVLIQHGTGDRTVPFRHGERLRAAATDAELIAYRCGHSDCPWERMMEDVVAFLRTRGLLPPA